MMENLSSSTQYILNFNDEEKDLLKNIGFFPSKLEGEEHSMQFTLESKEYRTDIILSKDNTETPYTIKIQECSLNNINPKKLYEEGYSLKGQSLLNFLNTPYYLFKTKNKVYHNHILNFKLP